MLLDTMNSDPEFLCYFLIFLIIKITLLQNGLSRVLQLFDAFFNALYPFLHFVGSNISILFSHNPIKIGILLFNLSVPQMINASVSCLYIQIGSSCIRLQILKMQPSFLEYIVDNILAHLFIRNETESVVIQTSIILLV